jgi:hypothetical protein
MYIDFNVPVQHFIEIKENQMNSLYPKQEETRSLPETPLAETFSNRSMELPDQLLVGAIDSHVHAGPVLMSNPGHQDPIEAALEARAAGMKAIVYYDVFGWASGTAWMVNRHVKGIQTFGGYLMNSCHGGMNPRAVKTALAMGDGCRFISFGSHCTRHSALRESTLINGKLVPFHEAFPKFAKEELSRAVKVDLDDPVGPELDEILSMIAEHGEVYLNTGHVSQEEALRLVELAERYKIRKVLIPHPVRGQMPVEIQKKLAQKGVFLEACIGDFFYPDVPRTHYYVEREYMDLGSELGYTIRNAVAWMKTIREVGPEQIVLATDYGVRAAPSAVQGMRTMITLLLDYEFSPGDITTMVSTNPSRLIGI